MPVSTLVETAGATNANSYCTVLEANQYHLDRPLVGSTTWADAGTDEKTAALMWATTLLDRMFYWRGWITYPTQRLMWPRVGLIQTNGLYPLSELVIPELLKFATAEYARQLLEEDKTADSSTDELSALKVGSINLVFKDSTYTKPVPDAVVILIPEHWGYLKTSPGAGNRDLERA
jgi:hypothetical protein